MKRIDVPNTTAVEVKGGENQQILLEDILGSTPIAVEEKDANKIDIKPEEPKAFNLTEVKPKPIEQDDTNAIYVTYKDYKGASRTKRFEIGGTKLKYFRNGLATGFNFVRAIPIGDLLTVGPNVLCEKSGEQIVAGFLVSCLNDKEFVEQHFDEFDAAIVDKLCDIFGRLNGIFAREEEQRKNLEAQRAKKKA